MKNRSYGTTYQENHLLINSKLHDHRELLKEHTEILQKLNNNQVQLILKLKIAAFFVGSFVAGLATIVTKLIMFSATGVNS